MVQVDVFWTYGIGAGFAVASARQRREAVRANPKAGLLDGRYFRDALLFLSAAFVPSGVCLLWGTPSWETMHVGDRSLPTWLVTLFAATNITQGVLGYAVAARLINRGKPYLAYLQWVLAYFCMFFILAHGWDGTGYKRFFSPDKESVATWTLSTLGPWIRSDVAITLGILGIFVVPPIVGLMGKWVKEGYDLAPGEGVLYAGSPAVDGEGARRRSVLGIALGILFQAVVLFVGTAVLASVCVRYLGWGFGALAFLALGYGFLFREGGLYHHLYRRMFFATPLFGSGSLTFPREAPVHTS